MYITRIQLIFHFCFHFSRRIETDKATFHGQYLLEKKNKDSSTNILSQAAVTLNALYN